MATLAANKAGIDIARVDEMLNHSDSTLKLARVYIERDYSVLWEPTGSCYPCLNGMA